MATTDDDTNSSTTKDVKQLGIWAALGSLSYVFWICGKQMPTNCAARKKK